jgi:hypothetical protein
MKPTSPLSLLLFLHLTTSAPIPTKHTSTLPTDCLHYFSSTCRSLLPSKPNTPPTTLSNPHFPYHQLSPQTDSSVHREQEAVFQNTPITPPKGIRPSRALKGPVPLESSYLLSLADPATKPPSQDPLSKTQSPTSDALPAKPTSALPHLRKEDAKRYWASLRAQTLGLSIGDEERAVSDGPVIPKSRICSEGMAGGRMYVGKPVLIAREYGDMMVVGIVVIFLAAVVVMEAVEKCGDLCILLPSPFPFSSTNYLLTMC